MQPTEHALIDQLHRAIDARVCVEHAAICEFAGALSRAFDWQEEAASIAISLAWENAEFPLLFAHNAFLRETWENTRRIVCEQQSQRQRKEAEAARWIEIDAALASGDWDALGLQQPSEALTHLLEHQTLTVHGYRVRYDAADGITWYTNPYGVDGILCNGKPSLEVVTGFLTDMARGKEYGLLPTGAANP